METQGWVPGTCNTHQGKFQTIDQDEEMNHVNYSRTLQKQCIIWMPIFYHNALLVTHSFIFLLLVLLGSDFTLGLPFLSGLLLFFWDRNFEPILHSTLYFRNPFDGYNSSQMGLLCYSEKTLCLNFWVLSAEKDKILESLEDEPNALWNMRWR